MRTILLICGLVFLMAEKAQAQIWIRGPYCGPVFPAYQGYGFSVRAGGFAVAGYSGFASPGFISPWVVGPTIVQRNVVWNNPWGYGWANRTWINPPQFCGPVWGGPVWGGWGFPLGEPVWAPPGIIVPAGFVERNPIPQRPIDQPIDRPFEPAPLARRPVEPTPQLDESRFIVIRPSDKPREPEVIVSRPQFPKLEPAPKVPKIEVPVVPAIAMLPEKDPAQTEQDRLEELGRTAFASGQYGRAVERFRKASDLNPKDASPLFHLAQAYIALGKYHEAAKAIRSGLELRPNWPDAVFSPRTLYGANAKNYNEHLKNLTQTQTQFGNDLDLVLVVAYQLWFDGKKEEAKALFAKLPKESVTAFNR